MKQIKATLELGIDGYGVSFAEIPSVFSFGKTVETAKSEAKAALELYKKILLEKNQSLPDILDGEYEIDFEFDVLALLKYFDGTVTKTALSRVSGINATQLTHYSSGAKKPRREQRNKIISGLHAIGRDLLAVS